MHRWGGREGWTDGERGREKERRGETGQKRESENNRVRREEGEGMMSRCLRRRDMSSGFIIPSISALFMLDDSRLRGRIYSLL